MTTSATPSLTYRDTLQPISDAVQNVAMSLAEIILLDRLGAVPEQAIDRCPDCSASTTPSKLRTGRPVATTCRPCGVGALPHAFDANFDDVIDDDEDDDEDEDEDAA